MSFASRTFQTMAQGGPIIGQSFSAINTSTATGTRSGTVTLVSDGTTTHTPNGGGSAVAGLPWYAPAPTAGIGSSYWCKLVVTPSNTTMAGSGYGTTVGAAPTVTVGGASWTFTNSATNLEGTGAGTLYIYSDSGAANLVATCSLGWDVGYAP